jgi:hypothetical protein
MWSAERSLDFLVNLTSLIPTLNSGSDGVEDDGDVKNPRMLPLACDFLPQDATVLIVKLMNVVYVCGALRDESALQKVWSNVVQVVPRSKFLDALDEGLLGDADEGVLDSAVN